MRLILKLTGFLLLVYLLTAYLFLPDLWKHYAAHPEFEQFSKTNFTAEGLAGDPLNIALIGTRKEITAAMKLADWMPADPLKITSETKLAESVLMNQSYPQAPVSNLFLFNRPQDMAFEKQVGKSARRRHHVRFWKTQVSNQDGDAVWIGSATYDRSVGFSHNTGQITHHIGPDIDGERDQLVGDLIAVGQIKKTYQVSGVGPGLTGENGARDPYYTDGELTIGVISPENETVNNPQIIVSPVHVEIKNKVWDGIRTVFNAVNAAE